MDVQNLFNLLIGVLAFLCVFIFNKTMSNTERIQRLEDTTNNEVKDLKQDLKEFKASMDTRFEKLDNKLAELSSYVHGKKNSEMQMEKTLNLLLKHLEKHDEKDN